MVLNSCCKSPNFVSNYTITEVISLQHGKIFEKHWQKRLSIERLAVFGTIGGGCHTLPVAE